MVILRSGRQTVHEDYNLDYCRHFLAGEYPNLSLYTLVQLRQLKLFLESNFDTIHHHEIANDRHHIELFLLAQWRQYHEDILLISTPLNNNNLYMTTFNVIMEHCKIKRCEINFDFDDEFLCRICCQEKCVGYGFLSTGVHSPCYGNQHDTRSL
jgi:hypothetical protein